jgi:adenylate cyclase
MKRCPQCHRIETDDALAFCRTDGTRLIADSEGFEQPTAILTGGPRSTELTTGQLQNARSIAVLPFVNMSADPENEYFCDGLAEELLNALTKINDLKVAARTSAFSFKGRNTNVSEIGTALNVKTVLEGSVRKSANRLRITAQLINAADGYHLWSERYDREMKDIFDVQDEITLAIVDALKMKLLGDEKQAVLKRHTDDTEAYQLYLKGRYYWNKRTAEGFEKALECFEKAIARDSNYALAYAGLADTHNTRGSYSIVPPKEAFPLAKAAADKALELDDSLAEAHNSRAFLLYMFDWNWAAANAEFEQALELNPDYATAHHWYGWYLIATGQMDKAEQEMKRAQKLDSLSLPIKTNLGFVYYFARDYPRAIEQFKKALEMDANFSEAHRGMGEAFEQQKMFAEAIAEMQKAQISAGDSTEDAAHLAHTYASAGKTDEAIEILNNLIALAARKYVSAHDIATIYVALGETDVAFKWLEQAYEEHSYRLAWSKVDPKLDRLRGDSRFMDLLRRINVRS